MEDLLYARSCAIETHLIIQKNVFINVYAQNTMLVNWQSVEGNKENFIIKWIVWSGAFILRPEDKEPVMQYLAGISLAV